MKFIEFIENVKTEEKALKFMEKHYPEIDYYNAEVYLKQSLSLESEVKIFDDEKIEGKIEMIIDNEKYFNLFTLDLLVETYLDFRNFSDEKKIVAQRVLEYRIKDA